ncbi:hypothetical protein BKA64DRAFT_196945 [Cadophora sp. MPI-SDFR-AT-0126]|nr:hypothetical protein BKA64DRAFT_196945 [Leotiomycetes sp. MPI-SDFR-AT-0126]
MSKRNINAVQEAELPATKKTCTTQLTQIKTTAKMDQVKHSSRPISFFGTTTKRGLSSEYEQPSSKRQCNRLDEETKATSVPTKETIGAKANTVGEQLSMDQLLDKWFGPDRKQKKLLPFTSFRPLQKPSAKKYGTSNINLNNNFKIDSIATGSRPKKARKKTVKKDFTIFEDNTATKAANPTTDEIKNNPDFQDFGSQEEIASSTTYIRRGTKTVMQLAGWKYANYVTEWLTPLAVHLDALTPYSGPGFEGRICTWMYRLEMLREGGIPHPRGVRYGTLQHNHPNNEEEWFQVEDVEELAEIMEDMHRVVTLYQEEGVLEEGDIPQVKEHCKKTLAMIVGYCLTFGGGMDVGGSVDSGYLEDGRRNPEFFRRLTAAWKRIVELYLDEDLDDNWQGVHGWHVWWVGRLRKRIEWHEVNDFIDWAVMENFWGDNCPPCGHFRRFGGVVNRTKEDPYGEERFQMGIDEFMY